MGERNCELWYIGRKGTESEREKAKEGESEMKRKKERQPKREGDEGERGGRVRKFYILMAALSGCQID